MIFTPDGTPGATGCCREIAFAAFPSHNDDMSVSYDFKFNHMTLTWSIETSFDPSVSTQFNLGPCYWRFVWYDFGINNEYEIDHVQTTCLIQPEIQITGVTDQNGCVGTISFHAYESAKIPFLNRFFDKLPLYDAVPREFAIPYPSPCDCEFVAPVLCVSGVRHVDGPDESVEFRWIEGTLRWEYLPPCGDPTLDREIFYLRGDSYGNCYLEFDSEQSGDTTNDWADPPNTLGIDPQDIRDGMIPIATCGNCGFLVQSEASEGRHITITSGPCGRWKHICENCRCVPESLCIFGEIDGQMISLRAVWDGDSRRWVGDAGGYVGVIKLGITKGDCDECVGMIENTYSDGTPFGIAFEHGDVPIRCDKFLGFELSSAFDPNQPGKYNWLWAGSGMCGCITQRCGICSEERCGGPPLILYLSMEGQINCLPDGSLPPVMPVPVTVCNLNITMYYWQRWSKPGRTAKFECGYIGYGLVVCPYTTYLITAQIMPDTSLLTFSRKDLSTGEIGPFMQQFESVIVPSSCDPYFYSYHRLVQFEAFLIPSGAHCPWECDTIIQCYNITVME